MSQTRSNRTRAVSIADVVLLLTIALGAGAESSWAQTGEESDVNIRILVYSGRPDPVLTLDPATDAESIAELESRIEAAPPAEGFSADTVIPAILGYKGMLISGLSPPGERIGIYRGHIEVGDGQTTRFLVDEDRTLEVLILKLAFEQELIDERLLRAEEIEWEKPPTEESE